MWNVQLLILGIAKKENLTGDGEEATYAMPTDPTVNRHVSTCLNKKHTRMNLDDSWQQVQQGICRKTLQQINDIKVYFYTPILMVQRKSMWPPWKLHPN